MVGEAVLDRTTGIPWIWDGSAFVEVALPVIIHEATDNDVLGGTYPQDAVVMSQATGNIWTQTPNGLLSIGLRVYTTQANLTADTPPDGTVGFAIDTGDFAVRANGVWATLSNQGVTVGNTAPPNPVAGDSWLDTSGAAPNLKVWDGNRWFNNSGTTSPVGTIIMYPNYSAPPGYLICDGRAVSQTTYPELYSVVGSNVPDLRGQFVRGSNQNGDSQGKTKHQDTTRMPRSRFTTAGAGGHVHDIAVGNTGGYQNAVTNYNAINGIVSVNNTWVGAYEVRMPGGRVFWSAPDHTHTVNGGDSETAPANVKLCFVIKHD